VPPPPHQSVTTFIATIYRQVLFAKWRKGHRRMKRGVREHRKGTKAHLRPVEPVGRPNMWGRGGGKGGKDMSCNLVRNVFTLTAAATSAA